RRGAAPIRNFAATGLFSLAKQAVCLPPERESRNTMTEKNATDKLWDLVEDIGTGMLVTEDAGALRARPMTVTVRRDLTELHMLTRRSSHKALELERDNRASLTFAEPRKGEYVSITGAARISQDREA